MNKGGSGPLVVVGLGSNLGDRLGYLRFGLRRLREEGLELTHFSPTFETPPLGYPDQPRFLNMVAMGVTGRGPLQALSLLQSVEREAGRERLIPNGPRTLDLDLIFFGNRIIREPGLTVPHPRWKCRSFVVRPLRILAPMIVDPETGLTVEEIEKIWNQEPKDIRELSMNLELPWIEGREIDSV